MSRFVSRSFVLAACAGCFAAGANAQCTSDWTAPFEVGGAATDGNVFAMNKWDADGPGPQAAQLIVGGTFNNAGGQSALRCARFDGSWHALGLGINNGNGYPSMAISWDADGAGPALPEAVFGGFFSQIAGVTVRNIARWNGSTWGAFGAGTQDINNFPDVYTATMWDPDGSGPAVEQLVIGGEFTVAGGAARRRVARWDGTTWQAFGTGMNDAVYSITTWDADGAGPQNAYLVAGGIFQTANSVSTPRIAKWDGTNWSSIGTGMDGQVESLTTWDADGDGPQSPRLVAGGTFLNAGGVPASKIAMFDGSAWQAMGAGFNTTVFTLTTWDPDGTGPLGKAVVAGGSFVTSGTTTVNRIAMWDGSQWAAFGTGMNSTVFEVLSWDADGTGPQAEGLVAGGLFVTAGSVTANHLAFWPACDASTPVCNDIDFNNDGSLFDPQDIDAYLSVYSEGPCVPDTATCDDLDFNNDTSVFDPCDIDSFLLVFSEGPCTACGG